MKAQGTTHKLTRVMIVTGGTGGHVYPALAVAEALKQKNIAVSWMGTHKGLEAKLVPANGIPIFYISVTGLRGKGLFGWFTAPFKLIVSLYQAIVILLKQKPDMVLGMGGFVSGPGGLATRLLQKPLVIHEQNTIPGMTNRWLAKIATRVVQAFPDSFIESVTPVTMGNPVRKEIETLPDPVRRYMDRSGPINILVVGGSLGAKALNKMLPVIFKAVATEVSISVKHQTGAHHLDDTVDRYHQAGIEAEIVEYIENMADAYHQADLVICRAGALTVSELAVAGVASVLIPYPYAVDDHQYSNAMFLLHANAALVVRQNELTGDRFIIQLKELLNAGRVKLLEMALNARKLARFNATEAVADLCFEVVHG